MQIFLVDFRCWLVDSNMALFFYYKFLIDSVIFSLQDCEYFSLVLVVNSIVTNIKSSLPLMFCRKAVLKTVAKFTRNTYNGILFFEKLRALACNFTNIGVRFKFFSVNFKQFFRNFSDDCNCNILFRELNLSKL